MPTNMSCTKTTSLNLCCSCLEPFTFVMCFVRYVSCITLRPVMIVADSIDMKVTLDGQLRRCADNRSTWLDLISSSQPNNYPEPPHLTSAPSPLQHAPKLSLPDPHNGPMPTMTFNCIADSLIWLSRSHDLRLLREDGTTATSIHGLPDCLRSADHIQVLCVGSLHLVGDILSLLDPFVCDK